MSAPSAEIAVLSGRGKTGQAVISALGRAGASAAPLGRAELLDLPGSLVGCRALYLMAPNMAPDEPGLVAAALDAARTAGITRIVYHSVVAPYAPQMPHHLNKAVCEDLVRRSGADWTILQPCAYIQNVLPGLQGDDPGIDVPYDPDRCFGLVDLRDVAEAAASVLIGREDIGATHELGGPELVSMRTVAELAEHLLARPVRLRRISQEEWAAGSGLDPRERDWLLAMFGYYDRHGLPAGSRSLTSLLQRRPRGVGDVLGRELTDT
ncbi:MAG: SDR family oxidoreductase [Janibacter sp.]